jgi:hypothetical protein
MYQKVLRWGREVRLRQLNERSQQIELFYQQWTWRDGSGALIDCCDERREVYRERVRLSALLGLPAPKPIDNPWAF